MRRRLIGATLLAIAASVLLFSQSPKPDFSGFWSPRHGPEREGAAP
jgi:hypothetical protein